MSTPFRTASARVLALSIPIAALMLVPVFADDKSETGTRKEKPAVRAAGDKSEVRGKETHRAHHNDALLARWLLIDNRNEVSLSKYAEDHAQTEQVKKFAQHMVHDHNDFINKLEPFAKTFHERNTPGAERREERRESRQERREERREIRRENQKTADIDRAPKSLNVEVTTPKTAAKINNEVEVEVRAQGDNAAERVQREAGEGTEKVNLADDRNTAGERHHMHHLGMIHLKQELADQCAKSIRSRLEQQKGEHFDHAFMNLEVMLHMQMLDTLKVFRHHASPEMAKVIDKGIDTTQEHLNQALEIAASFSSDQPSNVNKTTRSNTGTQTE